MIRIRLASLSVLSLFFALCCVSFANATDLIIDGVEQTISGENVFDRISIVNGGKLYVEPFNGTTGGFLKLKAKNVFIDSSSSIIADGKGYRGILNSNGEGPGGGVIGGSDGGGGGAYGGKGGNGVTDGGWWQDGAGGVPYGFVETLDIEKGSAGGASAYADFYYNNGGSGGNGGGAIWIEADSINNAGTISANGEDGKIYYNDSTGGGAGGGILLYAGTVVNSGALKANGGGGGTTGCGTPDWCGQDDGGGGGSGGRIKIFYGALENTGSISVIGGRGGIYAAPGENGTFFQKVTYLPVTIDIKPGSFPNSINLGSNGTLPVAILSSPDFDAATIDPATITLADAAVKIKSNGTSQASLQDVNGDGLLDLVVHVNIDALALTEGDTEARLSGKTFSGVPVRGSDSVRIVPAL